MALRTRMNRRVVVGLLGSSLALAACSTGISQTDFDAVKKQLASQEQKATALQQQLSAKEKEVADLQQKAAAAPAGKPGVVTLIGAEKIPPAPPAPTPTPLPPGFTPVPKPTPPPSLYESVGPFAFYVETLSTNHAKENWIATAACVPNTFFKRGMMIVWRFEVIDTSTGKRVTDRDQPTVKIKLPHGEDVTPRFSQRAGGSVPTAPYMWGAGWDIPLDYPLGALDYAVQVIVKDRTATWKPPALIRPASGAAYGIDSRVQIID
ncbi:MAG: hypothetical protein HYY04_00025 [Chloroflexi bacterium]|nr:hypothetical protein [Chloroflexota bacterium]